MGKTSVAIAVARALGTEIISADSRQCYRELNIGVARPSPAELAAVPHHFIASHSIHDKVNAATFEQYALEHAEEVFLRHNTVVMVGGTGLYIKAFCEGFDAIPEVPQVVQAEVRNAYAREGLEWLQQEVARLDPAFYAAGEVHNPQRLMRALEVWKATGQSILSFRKGVKANRDFRVVKLALDLPRQQLHQNINQRVDQMVAQGLVEEVRRLIPFQHLNALQTVGYRELFACFNNEQSQLQALTDIKTNTRQYAKRQLTWFRKDPGFQWFHPNDFEGILRFVQESVAE